MTCPSDPCDHIDLLAALLEVGIGPGRSDYHDPAAGGDRDEA